MAKTGRLTHIQEKERLKTVMQRVEACSKGSFIQVGENISYFEPAPVKRSDAVLDSMVDRIFRLWVDSKGPLLEHGQQCVHPLRLWFRL